MRDLRFEEIAIVAGGGDYGLYAPGDKFATLQEAGVAGATLAGFLSSQTGNEWAGLVVHNDDGTYSFTQPIEGTIDSSNPGTRIDPGDYTVGDFHSHGDATPGYDNEHFSTDDIAASETEHSVSFLATPDSNDIQIYDPDTNMTTSQPESYDTEDDDSA
jgi:hypothetical protein